MENLVIARYYFPEREEGESDDDFYFRTLTVVNLSHAYLYKIKGRQRVVFSGHPDMDELVFEPGSAMCVWSNGEITKE